MLRARDSQMVYTIANSKVLYFFAILLGERGGTMQGWGAEDTEKLCGWCYRTALSDLKTFGFTPKVWESRGEDIGKLLSEEIRGLSLKTVERATGTREV